MFEGLWTVLIVFTHLNIKNYWYGQDDIFFSHFSTHKISLIFFCLGILMNTAYSTIFRKYD